MPSSLEQFFLYTSQQATPATRRFKFLQAFHDVQEERLVFRLSERRFDALSTRIFLQTIIQLNLTFKAVHACRRDLLTNVQTKAMHGNGMGLKASISTDASGLVRGFRGKNKRIIASSMAGWVNGTSSLSIGFLYHISVKSCMSLIGSQTYFDRNVVDISSVFFEQGRHSFHDEGFFHLPLVFLAFDSFCIV